MLWPMGLDEAWRSYRENQPRAADRLGLALHRFVMPGLRRRFDTPTAEDLAQDTLMVVFRELDTFDYRGSRSLEAWVRRIVLHRVFRHRRRERRHARIIAACTQLALGDEGPRELTHWRERLAQVEKILFTIDPRFVDALLHLAEGRDPAELAHLEGVTKQTIHSRANRALGRLRSELRARRYSTGRFLATPRW